MAGLFTVLFYTFVLGVVLCGLYAILRCIQQNLRRAREARLQGVPAAAVPAAAIPAAAVPVAAGPVAIAPPAGVYVTAATVAGRNQPGQGEEDFQMPELREATMIRIEAPDGTVNLATWDESRATVGP